MIHWDWVISVLLIAVPWSIISAIFSIWTEPVKADRMKAEAALIEIKMRDRQSEYRATVTMKGAAR